MWFGFKAPMLSPVWVQTTLAMTSLVSGAGVVLTRYPDRGQVWFFSVPKIQSCGLDLPSIGQDYSPFLERGFVAWPEGWESRNVSLTHLVSRFRTGLVPNSVINFKLGTTFPWFGSTWGISKAYVPLSEGSKDEWSNMLLILIWLSSFNRCTWI